MDYDTFKLTLITPALLSAANLREADPNGLRGSSLRGMWRFWARAIWKGLKDDLSIKDMKKLEAGLFGDTERKAFRMIIKDITKKTPTDEYCLPHADDRRRFGKVEGLPSGSEYEIRIGWHPGTNEVKKKATASIIVMWSVLGSIGQRSRRGFGSVQLHSGSNFFDLKNLYNNGVEFYPEDFDSKEKFVAFVKQITNGTANLQLEYFNLYGIVGKNNLTKDLNDKFFKDMFTLSSFRQIYIGKKLGKNLYSHKPSRNNPDTTGPITKMHGRSNAHKNEHGFSDGNKRLASPLYLRLHKVEDEYLPLAVFSRRSRHELTQPFKNWLNDLGLQALGTGGTSSGSVASSQGHSSAGLTKISDDQAWEIPPDKQEQKPKRSKQAVKPVWDKFSSTPKLQRLIKNISLIDGVKEVIPDMSTYKKIGSKTSVPQYVRFNRMNFTCGASDGQVDVELKLTCKSPEQWYYVRRETGRLININ